MLGDMDDCLRNRQYPYILEYINDFYDRIREIYV